MLSNSKESVNVFFQQKTEHEGALHLDSNGARASVEVPLGTIVGDLLGCLTANNLSPANDTQPTENGIPKGFFKVPSNFFIRYLPPEHSRERGWIVHLPPQFWFHYPGGRNSKVSDRYAVLIWHGTRKPLDHFDWVFAFRKGTGEFEEFTVPPTMSVGYEGSITGNGFVAKMGDAEWPHIVPEPEKYLASAQLASLLTPGDANPLSMLLNANQPWKGVGAQLKQQLESIQKLQRLANAV